jgi:hypothetical protein
VQYLVVGHGAVGHKSEAFIAGVQPGALVGVAGVVGTGETVYGGLVGPEGDQREADAVPIVAA